MAGWTTPALDQRIILEPTTHSASNFHGWLRVENHRLFYLPIVVGVWHLICLHIPALRRQYVLLSDTYRPGAENSFSSYYKPVCGYLSQDNK